MGGTTIESTKARPNSRRPLTPDEVPESLIPAYDFTSQQVAFDPKRGSWSLTIVRTCPRCQAQDRIMVSGVRASLRKKNLTGVCKKCIRKVVHPNVNKGNSCYNWKGGRRQTNNGYTMVRAVTHPFAKNGYVFEHRLVMEKRLGRYLLPTETVHHKNAIKDDNRLENLEIWAASHGNGSRYDDLSITQIESLIAYLQDLLATKTQ